jgi:hypothetical protein
MSDVKALREQLAEADRQRQIAHDAESARGTIRLGQTPIVRRGLLGFPKTESWAEKFLTRAETNAVYDALAKVRDDARSRADEIEKTIAGGAV